MASRFQVGSLRTFMKFAGFLIVLGAMVALSKGHGLFNHLTVALWFAMVLTASVVVLIRRWRKRGSPDGFQKATSGTILDALPPKWRSRALGEDDPQ